MFTFKRTYTRPNTSVPFLHDVGNQDFNALYQSVRASLIPDQGGFISFIDIMSPDGLVKTLGLNWVDKLSHDTWVNSIAQLSESYENFVNSYATANNIIINITLSESP